MDSGAIHSRLSADLTDNISLKPLPANRKITVANERTRIVRGVQGDVPVKFGSIRIPLEFLVVGKTPFGVTIGCPNLEKLGTSIDLGTQEVSLTFHTKSITLGIDHERGRDEQLKNLSDTHSEDFTSDVEEFLSDFDSQADNESIDTMLFEKDPSHVKLPVMNETVRSPEKACTVNMNYEDNPSAPSRDEDNKNPFLSSQYVRNLHGTLGYHHTQRRAGEIVSQDTSTNYVARNKPA